MSAHQSGVGNGVASMGTSLTEEQIYAMQRVTKQVYVCYDGDTPGQRATNRALTILRDNSSLALGVIQMPEGMDRTSTARSTVRKNWPAPCSPHGKRRLRLLCTT